MTPSSPLWHIIFPSPKEDALEVIDLFDEALSASGFEDTSSGDWYAEVHFADEGSAREGATLARESFNVEVTIDPLPDIDWVEKSLEDLPVVEAGRFLIHGNHISAKPRPGQIPLLINAGQAFGTGHHGTTLGCLVAITDIVKKGAPRNVLDLGCGTAILGIGLTRLAPSPVLATDIDPIAIEVAREVATQNGCQNRLRFAVGPGFQAPEIARAAPFDLIIANILARPLVKLAPDMAGHVARGGVLILSGLLIEQERRVLSSYLLQGFRLERRIHLDEWSTLVLRG